MAEQEKVIESEHLKCASCGGEMTYSPRDGMLACPYCGHKQELKVEGTVCQHDYTSSGLLNTGLGVGHIMAHCDNCGADIALEKTIAAQTCPFCSSPMSLKQDSTSAVIPDGVIPFKVSQQEAAGSFKNWIKGRFFAPRTLHTMARMKKISGVYLPNFLFDSETQSRYTAEAGTHYYDTELVTVEKDGKTVQEEQRVQKTMWRPISGEYNDTFTRWKVNATKNADKKLIALDYNVTDAKPYTKEFLYGFQAENNSITLNDCWNEAKEGITNRLRQSIISHIAADEVRNLSFSTDFQDIKYQYVLFPAWVSSYIFKGKVYKVMLNGQTGQIRGQAPLSAARVLLSILLTAGVSVLLYFVNHYLGVIYLIVSLFTLAILANRKPK